MENTTLMKAFAASKGLTEKDARSYVRMNPGELDDF